MLWFCCFSKHIIDLRSWKLNRLKKSVFNRFPLLYWHNTRIDQSFAVQNGATSCRESLQNSAILVLLSSWGAQGFVGCKKVIGQALKFIEHWSLLKFIEVSCWILRRQLKDKLGPVVCHVSQGLAPDSTGAGCSGPSSIPAFAPSDLCSQAWLSSDGRTENDLMTVTLRQIHSVIRVLRSGSGLKMRSPTMTRGPCGERMTWL